MDKGKKEGIQKLRGNREMRKDGQTLYESFVCGGEQLYHPCFQLKVIFVNYNSCSCTVYQIYYTILQFL